MPTEIKIVSSKTERIATPYEIVLRKTYDRCKVVVQDGKGDEYKFCRLTCSLAYMLIDKANRAEYIGCYASDDAEAMEILIANGYNIKYVDDSNDT